jgi:calcineurin-like phosphoesterase family protein
VTIFFTGDHHFGHANILRYCKRSFSNIEEHDAALIKLWNSVVQEDDMVYHLGDFTLGDWQKAMILFKQLHGWIHVLDNRWHHDKRWIGQMPYYSKSHPVIIEPPIVVYEKAFEDRPIIICHYPFEEWDRKHYQSFHFHGHSHGTLPKKNYRLDVGVDNAYRLLGEYRPFTMEEALNFA